VTLKEVHEVAGAELYLDHGRDGGDARRRRGGGALPRKAVYPVQAMPTTEAAIDYGPLRDLYLVIGDPQDGGGWAVRGYIKPFANWLWGGALLMALGGLLSLATGAIGWRRRAAGAAPGCRRNEADAHGWEPHPGPALALAGRRSGGAARRNAGRPRA
jgi:cytochrome c-type biogenesis protein CcmF